MNKNVVDRSRQLKSLLILLLVFGLFARTISAHKDTAPEIFSYPELEDLYHKDPLTAPLENKLKHLLETPFVNNSYSGVANISLAQSPQLGKFLRVAEWNIERGLEYPAIEAAFGSEAEFEKLLNAEEFPIGSEKRRKVLAQAALLRGADVIVLNEVDWGMKRSGYRNIAAELAAHLKMNYAYGVNFVELSPVHLSREVAASQPEESEILDLIKVSPEQYKGLQGIAILSRFPLENVRLVPFKTKAYDWYDTEKKGASLLEKSKQQIANKIFLEETLREVRRGGRAALYADIIDPSLPAGKVTIAATHLENRTKPANRVKELEELLENIKDIRNPVILTGDMNTSTEDLTPTSIQRELTKRFGSPQFWIKRGITYALGFGLFEDVLMGGTTYWRKQADPTVKNIPFISPNPEEKFFKTLKKFRFADGGAFDFRGGAPHSYNDKGSILANSNQRGSKGFITTYQVNRPIKFVGKYKLDWFFIKPANLTDPEDEKQSYRFAPHFGRTLDELNKVIEGRISDHRPIIVNLPLADPSLR